MDQDPEISRYQARIRARRHELDGLRSTDRRVLADRARARARARSAQRWADSAGEQERRAGRLHLVAGSSGGES